MFVSVYNSRSKHSRKRTSCTSISLPRVQRIIAFNFDCLVHLFVQLLTGFRFFACGSFQQVIGNTTKIDKSTVCRTIIRVTKALLKLRNKMIYWPSEEECAKIAAGLRDSHNFPCVEGIIDGTHMKVSRLKEHELS